MTSEQLEVAIADGDDSGTERSYDGSSSTEHFGEIYLSFTLSLTWLFIATWANCTLYLIETFTLIYNPEFTQQRFVMFLLGANNVIMLVDIISMAIRALTRFTKKKTIYKQVPKGIFILDVLSMCTAIFEFIWVPVYVRYCVKVPFIIFRNYRIVKYYLVIASFDMMDKWLIFISKHFFIAVFYVYTCICIWSLTCPGCTMENHADSYLDNNAIKRIYEENQRSVKEKIRENATFYPTEFMFISSFFVTGSVSLVGFGNPREMKWLEQILAVFIMLSSYSLIILFISDLSSTTVSKMLSQVEFSVRLQRIAKQMSHRRIHPSTRRLIISHYITMWEKESLLNSSTNSELISRPMNLEILLDRFWFALNQSFLFSDEPLHVKRLVSSVMTAVHYDKGSTIVKQGMPRNKLYYVARGTVYVLSEEDAESPLLALGMGSSFGELALCCPSKCRFAIISKTYCILYVLTQDVFWKLPGMYCQDLKRNIKTKMNQRINKARNEVRIRGHYKALVHVKSILKDDMQHNITDGRKRISRHTFENAYDSYILSRNVTSLNDGIFYQTTWPWRLNETSSFMTIWEFFIAAVCIVLLFVWPWIVFYDRDYDSGAMTIWKLFFRTVFTLDVMVQLITVVETPTGTLCTFTEILKAKWNPYFIMDVIAAVPFDWFVVVTNSDIDQSARTIALSLRLVKLSRILQFVSRLERRYLFVNQTYFRSFGYLFLVIVFSYASSCFFYMLICYQGSDNCITNSWLQLTMVKAMDIYGTEEGLRIYLRNQFVLILYFSFNITTQNNMATINTSLELYYIVAMSLLSLLVYCILVSNYAASHILSRGEQKYFAGKASSLVQYLKLNGVNPRLINRVKTFLRRQFSYRILIRNKQLYYDMPEQMYLKHQQEFYGEFIKNETLFNFCPSTVLRIIASRCETIFVPVNELIIYAGDHTNVMYIIECGFCEILSPITRKVKQVVSEKSSLCVLEMILEQKVRYDIRAVTDMLLIQIRLTDIMFAFGSVPNILIAFQETITQTHFNRTLIENVFSTKKFQSDRKYNPPEEKGAITVFDKYGDKAVFLDYRNNITQNNIFWILQFIMLPLSIKPYSRFIYAWEILRIICVWTSCMIYPSKFVLHLICPDLYYYMIIVDVFLWIDIYLQMHVCFYNDNGILVQHPNRIAQKYIKNRFLVDLFGMFPFNRIVALICYVNYDDKGVLYESIFSLNKVILIIRSRCLINLRDPLEVSSMWKIITFTCAVLLMLYNVLACILMFITGDFVLRDNRRILVPSNGSWAYDKYLQVSESVMDPIYFFVLTYKYVTFKSIMVGFDRVIIQMDMMEKGIGICLALSGYFFFIWITVYIASTFRVNLNVSSYQHNVIDLKNFFRVEKISNDLANTCLFYYHHVWKRTYAIPYRVVDMVSLSLRKEIDIALYGVTLSLATPFADSNFSFRNRISCHFITTRYLSGATILHVNDIVDTMYIVHKGEVCLYYADGSKIHRLTRGGIFGNFDDVKMQRSMVQVDATMECVIMGIKTSELYDVLTKDLDIVSKLRQHILLNSLSFISSRTRYQSVTHVNQRWSRFQSAFHQFRLSKWSLILELFIAIVSYICVTTYIVFDYNYSLLIPIYIFDFLMLMLILTEFMYLIYARRWKTRLKKLKRKFKDFKLYTDVLSVLPIEAIPYFCGWTGILLKLFYLNRILRLYRLYVTFYRLDASLMVHVLLMKFTSVFSLVMLTMHSGICLFFATSCPDGTCTSYSWAMHTEAYPHKPICDNLYICSMFYTTTQMTGRGHSGTTPKTKTDIVLSIGFCLLCKFLMAMMMGYGLGLTAHYKYAVTKYNESAVKLQTTLMHANISHKLIKDSKSYLHNMWVKTRGRQLPVLISKAPMFLLDKIATEAFGRHIYQNPVFVDCHVDFNRQVVCCLKMFHYFRRDIICHEGDVNGTIYFVHSGQVEVLTYSKCDEIVVDILSADDCFGMLQGLFMCTKHTHTYRALSGEVIILQLLYSDWNYLLTFFPASKYHITQLFGKPTSIAYRSSIRIPSSQLNLEKDDL